MTRSDTRRENAERRLLELTGGAMLIGAVPVPAASTAIVAENAGMIAVIASEMGVPVTVETVLGSLGTVGTINIVGRTVFVEGARLLGWFAGPLGVPGVCVLGATTAGLQTWVIGRIAIAICEAGGRELSTTEARAVISAAKASFSSVKARARRTAATTRCR